MIRRGCARALATPPFQVGGYVDLGAWRIVLVDSCVPGRGAAAASAQPELRALDAALSGAIATRWCVVHHHPVSMASRWLDAVGIENAEEFFDVLDAHRSVRAISWGHVHQCFDARRRGVRLLATPSTGAQFLPQSDEFRGRRPAARLSAPDAACGRHARHRGGLGRRGRERSTSAAGRVAA